MSSTRRASRKRVISENENNLDNRQVDENNILSYKRRGEEKPDPIKRLRQLEKLQTDDVKVTCCDFGIDREQLFPNNFFCSKCKDWENRAKENKPQHRGMKKFTCKADHTSFLSPSKKIKLVQPEAIYYPTTFKGKSYQ